MAQQKKSGALAAGLNLVIPGAGYMYCGRVFLGIIALLFALAMAFTVPYGAIGLWLVMIIDGFLCAERYNRKLEDAIPKKRCPQCAEEILYAAKVCKHCGFNFVSRSQPGQMGNSARRNENIQCPFCGGDIPRNTLRPGTNKCPMCENEFQPK